MTTKAEKEKYLTLAPTVNHDGGVHLFDTVFEQNASKEVQQHALFMYIT